MGGVLIGAVLGLILWPWWAVPALLVPLYAMTAAKTCGWRIEIGLGCDALRELVAAAAHVAVGLGAWWLAAWLRRRSGGAGRQPPRP